MPKMKTNAAAKKRFSFTGTGKIKRKHAYHHPLGPQNQLVPLP